MIINMSINKMSMYWDDMLLPQDDRISYQKKLNFIIKT